MKCDGCRISSENTGSPMGSAHFSAGEVAEWLKAPVSKTGIPQGIGSSNLPLSDFAPPKLERA